MALHEAAIGQTIDQFYSAMMLNLQSFRDFCNPRPSPRRQALQRQHELVLSRFQSRLTSVLLTEVQKAPDLMPKFGQRPVID